MLIQPELVQNRRVQVAEVIGLLDRPETDRVGCANHLASPDAAAGQPHREADVVVVAPLAGLSFRRAAELSSPQHDGALEQASAFQVFEQSADRFVGLGGLAQMVLFDVSVCVPLHVPRTAARDDANESHAVLDELARQEATPAVIICWLDTYPVKVQCFLRLARQIEDFGSFGLHLECKVVGVDPRREFQVGWVKRGAIQLAD